MYSSIGKSLLNKNCNLRVVSVLWPKKNHITALIDGCHASVYRKPFITDKTKKILVDDAE
jgi:hypothetical protein